MTRLGQQHVFSWKQLLAVLLACAGTLYLLLPDDPTLLENLIDDGRADAAQRQLDRVTEAEYETDPLRYEIAQQRVDRLVVVSAENEAVWRPYLLAAVRRWREHGFSAELLQIWAPDLERLDDADSAWGEVTKDWDLVPRQTQLLLVEQLVAFALARERPDLAAGIFAATYGESPPDEETALELAKLSRLHGDTNAALTALASVTSPEVDAMRLALWQELNRNVEALDALIASAAEGEAWTRSAIMTLGEVARSAQQSQRAIPIVKEFVSHNSDDLEAWRLLVVLQRESNRADAAATSQATVVELSGRESSELREWARLLEGSSRPSKAFDVYFELSKQGDVPALERMVALNPGLFRDRELAEVLDLLVPVPNHDDYTLMYARILAKLGRYDESIAAYQLYLKASPRDMDAMFELAVLAVEVYEYQLAADVLRRIKDYGVNDVSAIRRLGDVWSKLGEYELALEEYRAAAIASGLPDDYGNFLRMARVLGKYEDFVAGLEGVVASDEATPSDYLTLAYGHQLLGQDAEAKQVMRDGMARFPDNALIPMRLGYAYGDAQRFREAQTVMAKHSDLGSAVEPTRYYLLLMRLNNDVEAERQFLKTNLSRVVLGDVESRRLLAGAYSSTRQLAKAEAMLRELYRGDPLNWEVAADLVRVLRLRQKGDEAVAILQPLLRDGDAARMKLAAEVFSDLGEYREAERYQVRYIEVADPVLPADWGALGDIRSSRGDFRGSKAAYRMAVQVFQQRLVMEAESPVR